MKITEYRTLSEESLRNLCRKQKWYTKGTRKELEGLLRWVGTTPISLEAKHIYLIACDIYYHSDFSKAEKHDIIDTIMFDVAQVCSSSFSVGTN